MSEQSVVEKYRSMCDPEIDDGLIHQDYVEPLLDLIDSQAKQIKAGYESIAMMTGKLKSMKDKIDSQAAELSRLREVVEAVKKLNEPDLESGKDGIIAIMDLLYPVADRFHGDLNNLALAAQSAAQQTGESDG